MEENKTVEVEVVEKESLLEMIKANKKTIIKRGLIIAGSIVGLVAAYKLMKADQNNHGDWEDVDFDATNEGDIAVTEKAIETVLDHSVEASTEEK